MYAEYKTMSDARDRSVRIPLDSNLQPIGQRPITNYDTAQPQKTGGDVWRSTPPVQGGTPTPLQTTSLIDTAKDTIAGLLSNKPLVYGALGIGAYFFFFKKKKGGK